MPRVIVPGGRQLQSLQFDGGATWSVNHGSGAKLNNISTGTYLSWV